MKPISAANLKPGNKIAVMLYGPVKVVIVEAVESVPGDYVGVTAGGIHYLLKEDDCILADH